MYCLEGSKTLQSAELRLLRTKSHDKTNSGSLLRTHALHVAVVAGPAAFAVLGFRVQAWQTKESMHAGLGRAETAEQPAQGRPADPRQYFRVTWASSGKPAALATGCNTDGHTSMHTFLWPRATTG